jgi:hypothetical protein
VELAPQCNILETLTEGLQSVSWMLTKQKTKNSPRTHLENRLKEAPQGQEEKDITTY